MLDANMEVQYIRTDEIDSGAVGTVYLADVYDPKTNRVLGHAALKCFDEKDDFDEELVVAKAVQGVPYFLQYIAADEALPAIVYEHAASGSLADVNCGETSRFPYGLLPFLVNTVEFLRKNNVAHRDIKSSNILALDLKGNWRLGDLGSMCRLGDSPMFKSLPLLSNTLVRCTYSYIPKPLLEQLRSTRDHYHHTRENMLEEVKWLDIYGAMDVIATTKALRVKLTEADLERPRDDVLRICWKGLLATSYRDCEAAWNELVDFVNETV